MQLIARFNNTRKLFALVGLSLTAVAANAEGLSRERAEAVLSQGEIISSEHNGGDGSYMVRLRGKVYFCRVISRTKVTVLCYGTGG